MDQQLDESENLQWKAQITQTIPVTIGQTLSILPIGITATVGLSMLASGQVSMKAGTVEACGKHAHLLKQSPTYRKMIEKSNLAEKFNY